MGLSNSLPNSILQPGVCTSTTRPASPYEGQVIFETDTNSTLSWSGAAWVAVSDDDTLHIDTANNRVGINDSTPSYTLDVNGDINTTGDLRIGGTAVGTWTTFTTTATNATISSQDCIWSRINNIVTVKYYIIFSAVTGNLSLSVPVNAKTTGTNIRLGCVGGGFVRAGSTSYQSNVFIAGSGTLISVYYTPDASVGAFVSSTNPTSGISEARLLITYEAA